MLLRKIKGIIAVFAICLVFTVVAGQTIQLSQDRYSAGKEIQYVIDVGHGIPDGGAVAADGTTEQELNLSIALALSKELEKQGIAHLLTRSDENSIFTEGESIHAKKVSDIKNRIAIAQANPTVPMISIHLNSFPNESVHGIQVFYRRGNEVSKQIAAKIQNEFNDKIQPDNTKTIKEISSNVYLFSHIENPAVLIECGFLSNAEELARLKTKSYQVELAKIMANALKAQG